MGPQNKPRNSRKKSLNRKRQTKAPTPPTAPPVHAVGAELRDIVTRLNLVEKYIIVCRLALDGQAVECDEEIALLLKRAVGDLLFEQIRDLENVAARCDGEPPSDRDHED